MRRVAAPVSIDGDLAKPPWSGLAPVALMPSNGRVAPPGFQPTLLRVAHDGARLLVAFACEDAHVWGTHRGRNQPIYEEEVVEAFLAPTDARHYLELESSPFGAWFEARIESPDGRRDTMQADRAWTCAGWERAARVREGGWDVEWAIPFVSIGAPAPQPGSRWRANFFRIDQANGGEYSAWSPTLLDPPDFHVPARFGVLHFE